MTQCLLRYCVALSLLCILFSFITAQASVIKNASVASDRAAALTEPDSAHWGMTDRNSISINGTEPFNLSHTTVCAEPDESMTVCGPVSPLKAAVLHTRPELPRVLPDRIGPGRFSIIDVRLMDRVLFQAAPQGPHVTVTMGSDQLLLDLDRVWSKADAVPIEDKAP